MSFVGILTPATAGGGKGACKSDQLAVRATHLLWVLAAPFRALAVPRAFCFSSPEGGPSTVTIRVRVYTRTRALARALARARTRTHTRTRTHDPKVLAPHAPPHHAPFAPFLVTPAGSLRVQFFQYARVRYIIRRGMCTRISDASSPLTPGARGSRALPSLSLHGLDPELPRALELPPV